MAALTITNAPGSYPQSWVKVTMNATNAGGDTFESTGAEMLLIQNTGAGSVDVSVISVDDAQGRAETIEFAVAAGAIKIVGPFTKVAGWQTPTGAIQVLADTPADTLIGVVRMPAE